MSHTLLALNYAYDALEPHIDALTMEIHHSRHHQTYINNLNAALETAPELAALPVEELLRSFDTLPATLQGAVRNHGGGHANHSLFWLVMSPQGAVSRAVSWRWPSSRNWGIRCLQAGFHSGGSEPLWQRLGLAGGGQGGQIAGGEQCQSG